MCTWFGHYITLHFSLFFNLWTKSFFRIFSHLRHTEWVLCEHNNSHSFITIFLKHCRHFNHGLKMCSQFGHYPHIYIFSACELIIFWHHNSQLDALWAQLLLQFYTGLFESLHVWSFTCGLDIITLSSLLIFVIFFKLWTFFFIFRQHNLLLYKHSGWFPRAALDIIVSLISFLFFNLRSLSFFSITIYYI